MAKLIFVTGPTTSGKSQYINRDRGIKSFVIAEAQESHERLVDIDDWLRAGHDVYVEWIVPDGTEIQWIPEGMR